MGQTALPDHASKMAALKGVAGKALSKVFDYFGIQFLPLQTGGSDALRAVLRVGCKGQIRVILG